MRWLRKWLELSLRTKCLFLISCPVAATAAMAGGFYLAGTRSVAAGDRLNLSLRIGGEIERLRTSEIEASAHMRAYLITADETFASKAREALAGFDSAWQRLSDLTAADPDQRRRLVQIATLERSRVDRIFGDTARFRFRDLPRRPDAALHAAEAERLGVERILKTMQAANTGAIDAYLAGVGESRARQNAVSAICLLFGIAGGVTMSLLFAHEISSRVGKLQWTIAQLASGADVDPVPERDEIGVLHAGLVQIACALHQRRNALEEALHGIAEADVLGRYRWSNKAYAKIAGLSEVYRPPTIQATLPAEDRPRIQEAIRTMHLGGRAEIVARIEPPSGQAAEVELIFLQSGPPEAGFYVFLREIGSSIVADRALIRAKDAAVASNRAKTDFLAKISHDIRTPLNAILGAADLLSQTSLTFDQSGYVHMFQRNCRRLVALINDFLDFSQIEAGAIHIEKSSFQIREIVDDTVATFREAAARKAIALGVYIDPMVPRWLMGDSLRIQQVLVNLLSNALKFTAEGRVEVRAEVLEAVGSDSQRLRCEVLDTGPGVALQDQDKIFMKFIQLPNQIAGQRGTGLGLTICRDLVELMGGEIGVSSQAGGGSSFHFSLPLEAAPQAGGQPGALAIHKASPPAASQLPAPGDAVRILVAEDNEDNRLLLEHYLRSEPVTLRFALTGREAVDVVQLGEEFDLILMDIDMPVLNGHGAAKAIRAWEDSRGVSTPIVALSADAMSEAVRSSLEAGCVAHVAKPVDRGTLLKTIRRYAKAHGARSIPIQAAAVSEQVQALVPQYLASKQKQIEAARVSLLSRDFGSIRRFGHDLKGTGRGYGFPAIAELGQQIEEAAGEADVDRIAGQLNALHRYVAESGAAATAATDSVREAR
jgi:signal transduction histidine kinase/CheY-like chemotaxis protein/HPt (histidine-containing phosphotransfer) domain-containing protein